ncbi:hypothetical protein B0H17DRAFT_1203201 [Mycena rosella]|uniref:Uncharacterized protein n=1 Tax=Mycena rosella TaxID=1033263 RepID=A0AAD7DBT6_MYCRO|nr:hypothetical protein B0H17DRAFT_1203201 [Mycena rosella]
MFFKGLTFTLAALAMVRAAPQMVSCSAGIDGFKAVGGIHPGTYQIYNFAGGQVGVHQAGGMLELSSGDHWKGRFAEWKVERAGGSHEYKISSAGLKVPVYTDLYSTIRVGILGYPKPDAFTIVPGREQGAFIISVPNEDLVWTRVRHVISLHFCESKL